MTAAINPRAEFAYPTPDVDIEEGALIARIDFGAGGPSSFEKRTGGRARNPESGKKQKRGSWKTDEK